MNVREKIKILMDSAGSRVNEFDSKILVESLIEIVVSAYHMGEVKGLRKAESVLEDNPSGGDDIHEDSEIIN